MTDEVISAISTPAGTGGVAIIRTSGKGSFEIAEKIFIPSGNIPVTQFEPYKLYPGKIVCEGFTDYGMCVCFKAPKSFTGEDVVEYHCHGGTQITRGVFKATLKAGARAAERGEFTKRAFINGKLTLSSAEGMIDMINAESLAEVRAGSLLYFEKLSKEVKSIQGELKEVLAGIAADVDYPEEGIEETEYLSVAATVSRLLARIEALTAAYAGGKLIKDGVSVAICGAPNVGKSSLLNLILGYDKAIVSPHAGTTRDVVEGRVEIDGVKYNFLDTAGIRENSDEIERVGIERAKNAKKTADVILCVSESGDFSAAEGEDGGRVINVFSMSDKVKPFGAFDVAVSSVTGEGLERLKEQLSRKCFKNGCGDGAFIIEERHHSALLRAGDKLRAAIEAAGKFPLDLLSMDIREAWRILGEITGETADEDIISTVFEKFCVGK